MAQGVEAGGHILGKIGLFALLSRVLDSVKVPVVAAGGIGRGRVMAAALAAGASGVRVGTRFVAAEEAGAHSEYVKALIEAEPRDTVVTEAFSEGWPHAPHRMLRFCIEEAENFKGDIVGQRRLLSTGEMAPAHRFESFTMTTETTGTLRAMPHWAGESVGGVKVVKPAAAIIKELVDEAETLLRKWP